MYIYMCFIYTYIYIYMYVYIYNYLEFVYTHGLLHTEQCVPTYIRWGGGGGGGRACLGCREGSLQRKPLNPLTPEPLNPNTPKPLQPETPKTLKPLKALQTIKHLTP